MNSCDNPHTMEGNSSNSKAAPMLLSTEGYPSFRRNMPNYMFIEGVGDVVSDYWDSTLPILGERRATESGSSWRSRQRQHDAIIDKRNAKEEKAYGILLFSLRDFPTLRNKIMEHSSVKISQTNKPQGSKVWRAIDNEIRFNPNRSIYDSVETRIDALQQEMTPLPEFLTTLDDLFDSLSDDLKYSDGKKILKLRKSLSPIFATHVKMLGAVPNQTYSTIRAELIKEYHNEQAVISSQAAHLNESNKVSSKNKDESAAEFVNLAFALMKKKKNNFQKFKRRKDSGAGTFKPESAESQKRKRSDDNKDSKCNRCDRNGHFAAQCWSKFHADGSPLDSKHDKKKHVDNLKKR